MPELYHALYYSKALLPNLPESHNDVLTVSQRNNRRDQITGFLHREQDHFIQYLEGPKTNLFDALQRIGRDPRHTEFSIKHFGPAERRMLAGWDMGFSDASQLSLSELLDTSDGALEIRSMDPFDLVVFVVHNAQVLQSQLKV